MTLSSRFFADGSYYGQSDLAKLLHDTLPFGYVSGVRSELAVTAPGGSMTIQVGTGRGYINGYMFDVEDAPYQLTVDTADPNYQRIDRVVARLSIDTSKNIILVVKKGTPSATPAPPEVTRSGDTWEISLAKITVPKATSVIAQSNIADERGNYTVCGIANEQLVKASRLTGTISGDRLPTIPVGKIPDLDAGKITSGVFVANRLPTASSTSKGVVKVGAGLSIDSDGTLRSTTAPLYLSPTKEEFSYYLQLNKNPTSVSYSKYFNRLDKAPFSYTFTYDSNITDATFGVTLQGYSFFTEEGEKFGYLNTIMQGLTITDDTTEDILFYDYSTYSAIGTEEVPNPVVYVDIPDTIHPVKGHTYTIEFASGSITGKMVTIIDRIGLTYTVSKEGITPPDLYLVTNGV